MSSEADKKNKQELVIVEVQEYDNIKIILSKIIVPFSEFTKKICALDVYSGGENIHFENRDPLYKSIMKQEFTDAIERVKK